MSKKSDLRCKNHWWPSKIVHTYRDTQTEASCFYIKNICILTKYKESYLAPKSAAKFEKYRNIVKKVQ